jgi:hypothetical protein
MAETTENSNSLQRRRREISAAHSGVEGVGLSALDIRHDRLVS